jgi:hypothetical protein
VLLKLALAGMADGALATATESAQTALAQHICADSAQKEDQTGDWSEKRVLPATNSNSTKK